MAANELYRRISLDTEGYEEILEKAKELDARFHGSNVEIDHRWTTHNAKLIEGHPTDRLIVFRPQKSSKLLGCIRVYEAETTVGKTTKLWDVFEVEGTYIGKIPKDCPFEAMLVEVKLITLNDHAN
ncbi:hypothetical protein ASPCAL07429 [Aspergillus calidoustus]|uniref:Uncharacterized protein n=1 Tax=Aspergillus calidoustus TaxID=454130 RepID=A0A0U5G401_ASPCI|nr:hypothetical protein ASPCAL07429 [Aspergillus calidoustus]